MAGLWVSLHLQRAQSRLFIAVVALAELSIDSPSAGEFGFMVWGSLYCP